MGMWSWFVRRVPGLKRIYDVIQEGCDDSCSVCGISTSETELCTSSHFSKKDSLSCVTRPFLAADGDGQGEAAAAALSTVCTSTTSLTRHAAAETESATTSTPGSCQNKQQFLGDVRISERGLFSQDASGKPTEPKSPRFKPRGGKEKMHTNQEVPQGNAVSISQHQMYTGDQPATERYSPSRGRDRFGKKESRREGRDSTYRPQAENARYQRYISETDEPEHILNSSLSPASLIHKQIKSTTSGGQTTLAGCNVKPLEFDKVTISCETEGSVSAELLFKNPDTAASKERRHPTRRFTSPSPEKGQYGSLETLTVESSLQMPNLAWPITNQVELSEKSASTSNTQVTVKHREKYMSRSRSPSSHHTSSGSPQERSAKRRSRSVTCPRLRSPRAQRSNSTGRQPSDERDLSSSATYVSAKDRTSLPDFLSDDDEMSPFIRPEDLGGKIKLLTMNMPTCDEIISKTKRLSQGPRQATRSAGPVKATARQDLPVLTALSPSREHKTSLRLQKISKRASKKLYKYRPTSD